MRSRFNFWCTHDVGEAGTQHIRHGGNDGGGGAAVASSSLVCSSACWLLRTHNVATEWLLDSIGAVHKWRRRTKAYKVNDNLWLEIWSVKSLFVVQIRLGLRILCPKNRRRPLWAYPKLGWLDSHSSAMAACNRQMTLWFAFNVYLSSERGNVLLRKTLWPSITIITK